jgi:16S rRNA (guanine527-N7)-methyltransferase
MEEILQYFGEFTDTQLAQFGALRELYTEWNSKINVISRKDIDSLYSNHVLHSLTIAAYVGFRPGTTVIDIGTGGGFPGIPLAIFFPECEFLLVDSIGKKLKVVEAVAEATGLQNVKTQHTRVEDIRNRKFDFVVSRAVAPLGDLWRWGRPLIKPTGFNPILNGLICLKGGDLALEISESRVRPYVSPVSDFFPEPHFKDKYLLYVSR